MKAVYHNALLLGITPDTLAADPLRWHDGLSGSHVVASEREGSGVPASLAGESCQQLLV